MNHVRIKFGDHYLDEGHTYIFGASKEDLTNPDLLIATMIKYPGKQGKQNNMRHKLAILICLALIAGMGLYAKQIHDQYLVKASHAASFAHNLQLKVEEAAKQQAARFQAAIRLDEAQCARDQAAYKALTPTQKLRTEAPDCEVNLQQ